jgi:stress response protein YsnF
VTDYQPRHAAERGTQSGSDELTRHEQQLRVGTRTETVGSLRLHTTVESGRVSDVVDREVESAEPVRTAPLEHDSGEIVTLPDGSVSVPVFEEEIVITKRLIVRERVVIKKKRVTENARIEAELLRERVDVKADPGTLAEDEDGR